MESAVVNVVAPGERFLVCTNGQWGPVFRRLIETFDGEVDEVVGPFGGAIDLEAVEKHLKAKRYTAVFAVHSRLDRRARRPASSVRSSAKPMPFWSWIA